MGHRKASYDREVHKFSPLFEKGGVAGPSQADSITRLIALHHQAHGAPLRTTLPSVKKFEMGLGNWVPLVQSVFGNPDGRNIRVLRQLHPVEFTGVEKREVPLAPFHL